MCAPHVTAPFLSFVTGKISTRLRRKVSQDVVCCFQTERVYHCDITKGTFARTVISQSGGSAQLFVCVLIGSVGS